MSMRTDRRRMIMVNKSVNKVDFYGLLGKIIRFHPKIDNSYNDFISSWDTSNVTDLSYCFQGCTALQSLDLSSWDVSNVTDLSFCFQSCTALQSLDLSSWDTSKLQSLRNTFNFCGNSMSSIDLSNMNFSSLKSLEYTFSSSNIKEILLPELGENNMLISMYCTWYNNANIEKLDLPKFNTKNVTNFGWCFDGALMLKWLDISGFDLSSATDTSNFFGRNKALTHLILGEGFGKVRTGITMDMSSFASLDEESKESFMTLYDRKANGLPNMTLKLKTSYGFTDEQVQSLTNKGYTINLV